MVETTLAPAALLASRFGLLPEGTDAVELDTLLSYFYRLPRLPKLAGAHVLRQALAEGVEKRLFGLASGSSWDSEDAVVRFREHVDPGEIEFQPGTWLVRAAAAEELKSKRRPSVDVNADGNGGGRGEDTLEDSTSTDQDQFPQAATTVPGLTLYLHSIPGSKVRDVVKVAVLPLSAASSDVTVELVLRADGGLAGIPRDTLNLVVLEGLRQLGLNDFELKVDELADG